MEEVSGLIDGALSQQYLIPVGNAKRGKFVWVKEEGEETEQCYLILSGPVFEDGTKT